MPDQTIFETISLSDAVSISVGNTAALTFLLSDSLAFNDALAFITVPSGREVEIPDTLNFNDFVATRVTVAISVSDALSLSDSLGTPPDLDLSDSLALSDAISLLVSIIITDVAFSVSDSLQLFDSVQFSFPGSAIFVAVGDMLLLSDMPGPFSVNVNTPTDSYLRRYLNDVV